MLMLIKIQFLCRTLLCLPVINSRQGLVSVDSSTQLNLGFKQQKLSPMCTRSGVVFCCLQPMFDCSGCYSVFRKGGAILGEGLVSK